MRTLSGKHLCLGLVGVLAFVLAGCDNGGDGDSGAAGTSFALTPCEGSDQCDAGFECAVFPCPADCDADTDGGCDTCQAGAICLPQPPAECDPALCGPGQVCQRACSGGCDLGAGQCYDVACQVTCLPVGTPTEPDPDQACVTDFTDACLPPDYPVAARLDDVCAAQGLVLTDVSVAAECWPGAVQFKWTCCRGGGQSVDPGQPTCMRGMIDECLPADAPAKERIALECEAQGLYLTDLIPIPCENGGLRWEWTCCGDGAIEPPYPTCETRCDDAGVCYETCCDPTTGECWGDEPMPPYCYSECDGNDPDGACREVCCDPTSGECWGNEPQPPYCYPECDAAGQCYDVCCDPTTGACWGGPSEPTQVCVEGGYNECFPEGIDVKERAWADCSAQNLELVSLEMAYMCDDGLYAYKWTCCSATTEPPPAPTCDKQCDANDPNGGCYEVCCDPMTGQCWTNGPDQPQPQCWKECQDDGTCTETCCDAAGTCWTTTWPGEPQPPVDPNACTWQTAGGDGTCTDLETLLAYASWTCAASGLTLTESSPWGECDGGFQGLKFACCGAQP